MPIADTLNLIVSKDNRFERKIDDKQVIETAKAFILRKVAGGKGAGNVSLMPGYASVDYRKAVNFFLDDPRVKDAWGKGFEIRTGQLAGKIAIDPTAKVRVVTPEGQEKLVRIGGVRKLVPASQFGLEIQRRIAQLPPEVKVIEAEGLIRKIAKPKEISLPIDPAKFAREKFIREKIKSFRDLTTLGLTREAREREALNKEIEDYSKKVEIFEKRFGNRELTQQEYNLAITQSSNLDKTFKDIEKKEQEFKKSVPTKIFEATQTTLESLRKQRTKIVQEKGIKALMDPSLKNIDKKLQALGVAQSFISAGIATLLLPETIASLAKDPAQLKNIPSSLMVSGKEFAKIAMISPNEAIAKIGAEVLLLKGFGKAIKVTGKFSGKLAAKLTGKLKKIKASEIILEPAKKGKGLTIKTISIREMAKAKPKVKIAITKPKLIPAVKLEVLKPGLKKIIVPTAAQKKLIGKKIRLVTSAQADQLFNLVKRKRIIRKPIPGEINLTAPTKQLLKKFDKGKISRTDFMKLNKMIIRETRGQSDLLERSFFVDPMGRIRISRLGIQKEASLSDILRGNFSFKTQKPQIIFFEDIKVQQFPRTKIFESIKKKLAKQKTLKQAPPKLTKSEYKALLQFQTKVSGKFKPIGKLTVEPELTLAPGEIIKKIRTVAKVEINGRIVPIVKAQVVKASKSTKALLRKARTGKISGKEIKILRKKLKRETGFKQPQISRRIKPKPRVPIRRMGVTAAVRALRKRRIKRKPVRRPKRPKKVKFVVRRPARPKRVRPPIRPSARRPRRPAAVRPTRPPKRPPARPPVRPPKRPPARPPVRPVPILPRIKKIRRIKRKKKIQAYNVYARPLKKYKKQKRPKLIRINKVPLSKRGAEDLRNYIVDTSLARTGYLKPTKGKIGKSKLKIPKGYGARTKYKFRTYRIIKGKKKPLSQGKVIEMRKRLLDTIQEKKKISLSRRLTQLRKPIKRKISNSIYRKSIRQYPTQSQKSFKRSLSPAQLNALAKGRRIRMRNLRRK